MRRGGVFDNVSCNMTVGSRPYTRRFATQLLQITRAASIDGEYHRSENYDSSCPRRALSGRAGAVIRCVPSRICHSIFLAIRRHQIMTAASKFRRHDGGL